MENPEMHSAFATRLFQIASEQLDVREDDLRAGTKNPARDYARASGFLPATVGVTPSGVSLYIGGNTHGENLTTEQTNKLTDAVLGWAKYEKNPVTGEMELMFFTDEMVGKRRAGENIPGVLESDINNLTGEGFLSEWAILTEPTSGRKDFQAGPDILGDQVVGRDNLTGERVEGKVVDFNQEGGIVTINTGTKLVESKMGDTNKVDDTNPEFKLPPLQPSDEIMGTKEADTRKLEEYYWKFGDEEISERIGDQPRRDVGTIGKGSGLYKIVYADGHVEMQEAISNYDALKNQSSVYTQSKPMTAELINKKPSGRRLGVSITGIQNISVAQVNRVINDLSYEMAPGTVRFRAINSMKELTREERSRLRKFSPTDKALFDRRPADGGAPVIYIMAENHTDEVDVRRSIFHETIGHLGFERTFGPARLVWISQAVNELYSWNEIKYIYEAYGFNPNTPTGRYQAAMEKIAEISETLENPGLWRRFVAWFKEMARQIFKYDFSIEEDDIRAYLWRSRNILNSESAMTPVEIYNNMIDQAQYGGLSLTLPLGPLQISARADTSPDDVDRAKNAQGWRAYYEARQQRKEHFVKQEGRGVWNDAKFVKDLGFAEAFGSLPVYIAESHPEFKPVLDVEWERGDDRMRDKLHLLRNPDTNTGDNPYLVLKDSSAVDKMSVWSDQNNVYLADEYALQDKAKEIVGRKLTPEEIVAYNSWKKGFDRAVDYAISKLSQTTMALYKDRTWGALFDDIISGKITLEQALATIPDKKVQTEILFAKTLTDQRLKKIADLEAKLRSFEFYMPHVRGNGKFVVRVFYTDNTKIDEKTGMPPEVIIWAERYEDATKAEMARARLTQAFPDTRVVKIQDNKVNEFIYGSLSVPSMEAFLKETTERVKQQGKIAPEVADQLLGEVFKNIDEMIMARGFRQHYIQRHRPNAIGGYQTAGLKQVFMDYMSGLAGSMTKLEAAYKFHKALQGMLESGKPDLHQYAVRYVNDMLRNSDALDRRLTGLKVIPYTWYLSMNLRLAATQFFQNAVTAYPILSRLQKENGIKGPAWLR
ncbi:MAG: hypothetical protein ABID54_10005, partial [Pseudomonadota bacterium]